MTMPLEIWKTVDGYGGHYEASSLGNIRSKDRVVSKRTRYGGTMLQFYPGAVLIPYTCDKVGHLRIHIGVDGKKLGVMVHRLVLMAFVGLPPDGTEACHGNGIAWDNRIENLRWDTHLNNNRDRKAHGHYAVGEDHHMAKFSYSLVLGIRDGSITRTDAISIHGMSPTHFWSVRTNQCRKHIA